MVESTYIAINVNAQFMSLIQDPFYFLSRFAAYFSI